MATNYPASLDNFTNPQPTDQVSVVSHSDQHSDNNDAIEAIEAKVGIDGDTNPDSLDYRINSLEDSVNKLTDTGFDSWSASGPYYSIIGSGASAYLKVLVGGTGYIKGTQVTWVGNQSTSAFADNTLNYVYIDSDGTIGSTTSVNEALYQDNIVLFEVLDDGSNHIVVRENHPYKFDESVSHYLHNTVGIIIGKYTSQSSSIGADITRVATGTGGVAGDRQIKIVGNARLYDHGIETVIQDSGGSAVTWNVYYLSGAGKWERYAQQTELPMYYNNAGTPTALGTGPNDDCGIFRLYISKDDGNTATPTYYAVMHTNKFNLASQADTEINSGLTAVPTNELAGLELAQLGFAVVTNNGSGGFIDHLTIQKAVVNATIAGGSGGGGGGGTGATTTLDTSNFNNNLSGADTDVQTAMETIDELDLGLVGTKEVDEADIADGAILSYDSGLGKVKYVAPSVLITIITIAGYGYVFMPTYYGTVSSYNIYTTMSGNILDEASLIEYSDVSSYNIFTEMDGTLLEVSDIEAKVLYDVPGSVTDLR